MLESMRRPGSLLTAVLALTAPLHAQDAVDSPPPHAGFTLPRVDGGQGTLAEEVRRPTVVLHFASW